MSSKKTALETTRKRERITKSKSMTIKIFLSFFAKRKTENTLFILKCLFYFPCSHLFAFNLNLYGLAVFPSKIAYHLDVDADDNDECKSIWQIKIPKIAIAKYLKLMMYQFDSTLIN